MDCEQILDNLVITLKNRRDELDNQIDAESEQNERTTLTRQRIEVVTSLNDISIMRTSRIVNNIETCQNAIGVLIGEMK